MKTIKLNILLLLISGALNAQVASFSSPSSLSFEQFYPGHVVTADGEKIEGEIQWINRAANQRIVNFKGAAEVKTYRKGELKSYNINGQEYGYVEDKNYGKRYPAQVAKGGMFVYYSYMLKSESSIKGTNTVTKGDDGKTVNNIEFTRERSDEDFEETLLVKRHDGDKLINLGDPSFAMGFKKNMSGLVDDNKALAAKILGKEKGYKMINRDKIIMEYNDWYSKK